MPHGDADYPNRWRRIKGQFTTALRASGAPLTADRSGAYRLWHRRYWEHTIRDDDDFARHVDYIHINPVKHGLVARVADWPYSSFHRAVRGGDLAADWGGVDASEAQDFGERS